MLFWSTRYLLATLVGSRPCCKLPAKKQEGRRAGTDQGSCPPLPLLSMPCQDCTVPTAPAGLAHILRGLARVPEAARGAWGRLVAVPRWGQNAWWSWGDPSSPGAGHPRVAPATVWGGEALLGVRVGLDQPGTSQDDPLRWHAGSPAEAWGTQCTSQCPAGSPGSERETAATNSLAAWQKMILVHVEITLAQEWGGGCRRPGHPRRASASSAAVFAGVTPGCRRCIGEWFGHGDVGSAWSRELLSAAAVGRDGDRDGDAAPVGTSGWCCRCDCGPRASWRAARPAEIQAGKSILSE